jgi:hypothetical protein
MATATRNKRGDGRRLNFLIGILSAALLLGLTGCQSGKFSNYVSPRVTGRVLAADTQQPLSRATVRRVTPQPSAGSGTLPKGGQIQMEPGGVRTDTDGRFVLESERVITVFHRGGWQSVTVSFAHAGYQSFQTNYTAGRFKERSPEGVPLVNAGDILLEPGLKSPAAAQDRQ